LPPLKYIDGASYYDGWNYYSDSKNPEHITLVTGVSYDKDDNHYSTYAITTKIHEIDSKVADKQSALIYAKKNFNWRTVPQYLKNKSNDVCVGDSANDYAYEQDIIYVYQAICFDFKRNTAIEFLASGIKSKAKTGSEFAQFTGRLFSTYSIK
jgi:phospholipase/lecithinase/hemolysin